MIAKVIQKQEKKQAEECRSSMRSLLNYLYGPGRHQEHHDPHLVASWDGLVADPAATASPEEFAAGLARLSEELSRLVLIHAGLGQHVWHCAVRTAPADRVLTDREWNQTARELVDAAGIAPKGDPAGCRWIAVRHADDHIHLVATLRRMDGKIPHLGNDYLRLRQACRRLEEHYGLTVTPPVDWTASRQPKRSEIGKAQRLGRAQGDGMGRGQDMVAGALRTGPMMRRLPASGPARAPKETTMRHVTAEWALETRTHGQSESATAKGSSRHLTDRLSAQVHGTGPVPGADAQGTEQYPRVAFGPLALSGDRYLAVTMEEGGPQVTRSQEAESIRRVFAFPLGRFPPPWTYRGIHGAAREAASFAHFPSGKGARALQLNLPAYDVDGLAALVARHGTERVTATAAMLLEGSVDVTGAAPENHLARLDFLDVVAALLPYPLRLQLAASTGVTGTDHQMRLTFATHARPDAYMLDSGTPTVPAQARWATEYAHLLQSAAQSPERLARVIHTLATSRAPQTFGEPSRAVEILRNALALDRVDPRRSSTQRTASPGTSPDPAVPAQQAPVHTARQTLAERVRRAVAGAGDEQAFFRALSNAGVRVRTHDIPTPDGDRVAIGYEVHLPGDINGDGQPIWYAGSTLAPDLSLPRVRERWQGVFRPPSNDTNPAPANTRPETASDARARVWDAAVGPLEQAAESFTAAGNTSDEADTDARTDAGDARRAATSQAVGDLLTVAAEQAPGQVREQLTAAAAAFERGARVPIQRAHDEVSSGLRLATQAMHAAGQAMTRGQETAALTAVIVAGAGALQAALAWYRERRLTAQAASTQRAITHLRLAAWQLDPVHHAPDRASSQRPDLRHAVQTTLGGVIDPARIITDPAYPTLATVLSRAEQAGYNPAQLLHAAAGDVGLGSAQVPAVPLADALAFHIQQRLHALSPLAADGHLGPTSEPSGGAVHGPQDALRNWDRYADIVRQAARQWFGDQQVDLRSPELAAALDAGQKAGLDPQSLLHGLQVQHPQRNGDGELVPGADRAFSRALADQVASRIAHHHHAHSQAAPDWAQLRPVLVDALGEYGLSSSVDSLYTPALEDHLHRAQAAGVDIAALVRAAADAAGPVASADLLRGRIHRRVAEALHRPDRHFVEILRTHLPKGRGFPAPDQVAADPAWKAVLTKLNRVRAAGHQPEELLRRAVTSPRGFKDAESVAKVISWRIDHLTGGRTWGRPNTGGPHHTNTRPKGQQPLDRTRIP